MKFYQCDRCGCKLDDKKEGYIQFLYGEGRITHYDLCDICLKAVEIYIKKGVGES